MGCVYRPKRSPYWWIKYYVNGVAKYESTRLTNHKAAGKILTDREGRRDRGEPILPRVDRVLYDEIATDLRTHYTTTACRVLREAETRLAHLDRHFTGQRAAAITEPEIAAYAAARQAAGAAHGTINREIAVLGRMLRLAEEHRKVLRVPRLRKLKEAAPRAGFFERDQYEAVRAHLPAHLRVAVSVAYTLGWRMLSEVLPLQRRHLDLEAGVIRLDPGTTKNAEGRVVALPAALRAELAEQLERVAALERKAQRVIPWLFPHPTNGRRHHRGDPIRNFRKAWASACIAAGCFRVVGEDPDGDPIKVPTMLRHDFRRTAVRNLVNAGVPERVAMTVTGHKTRAVFDRYHIVSPGDLQDAARKLEAAETAAVVTRTVIRMAEGRK